MREESRSIPPIFFLFLVIVVTSFLVSGVMAAVSTTMAFAVVAALIVCLICFIKPEAALYILVFSMLLSPEFGERTTAGGGVTLRVDDFLLVLIGLSWLARMAIAKDLGLLRKTKLNGPIFIYLVVCIIATALGVLLGNVKPVKGFFFVLKYFEYYVVYFMVVNIVHDRKHVQYLIISLLVTCVVVDIVALAQIPSGKRLSAPFEGEMGEPNTLGGYLMLIVIMSLALFVYIDSRKVKFLLLITAGLSTVPFLLSLSRGSYLSIVPAYFTLIVLSEKKGFLIIALLLAVLSAPFTLPESVVKRVSYTFSQRIQSGQEQVGGVRLDTSTSIRLRSWTRGFEDAMKRPIFGYGVTGWHFIDNQFTKVLVETGFVGLSAFLFLLFSIYKESLAIFKSINDKFFKGIIIGFMAGLVGMIVHSIGANTFIIVRIMEPFWLMAGIVMVIPEILLKETEMISVEGLSGLDT